MLVYSVLYQFPDKNIFSVCPFSKLELALNFRDTIEEIQKLEIHEMGSWVMKSKSKKKKSKEIDCNHMQTTYLDNEYRTHVITIHVHEMPLFIESFCPN